MSQEQDLFGMNRLKVDWKYSTQDVESVVRCCQIMKEEFSKSEVGEMEFDAKFTYDKIIEQTGVGSHHIGTTRMAGSPSKGVVDKNCRVFGIENLFIASSSVFPTSSYANPTLTIVALSIRIADHLKVICG